MYLLTCGMLGVLYLSVYIYICTVHIARVEGMPDIIHVQIHRGMPATMDPGSGVWDPGLIRGSSWLNGVQIGLIMADACCICLYTSIYALCI
jgi:hypothetical protein